MSNPVLKSVTEHPQNSNRMIPTGSMDAQAPGRTMTLNDVISKTFGLLCLITVVGLASAAAVIYMNVSPMLLTCVGGFGALAVIIYAAFAKKYNSPAIAMIYSVLEGMFLGAATIVLALSVGAQLGTIAVLASIAGTVGILGIMLFLYRTGIIKVGKTFTNVVVFSTLGILVVSIFGFVLSLMGIGEGLRSATPLGMLFSLFCIVVASLNFCLDFKNIDNMIQARADESNSWGAALGLITTLVWLYIEILRLVTNVMSSSR